MVLPLQTARLKPMRLTTRHSNDRLVLSALWERATQDGSAAASRAARAGLGNRIATAAFAVLIPLFAFALVVPPERSTSVIGRSAEPTADLQSLMRIPYALFCLKHKITSHHLHSTRHSD